MHELNVSGLRTALRAGAAAALALALNCGQAQGFDPWVVRNFQVEGAQRISTGTIYNYLPLNIGDNVTDQRVQESIRALYSTGFFQDVEFRRDADTLVIAVLERPSIEEFTIGGNDEIKTEDLEESLRQVGLTRGKVFDRSVLEEVQQFLYEQYYSRGRYGVSVETPIEDIGDNRVRVGIEIEEGARSKIRQINVVGNTSFSDREILGDFELSTGNWLSFIRNDDRYSKEALEGDLESLRSFYMDRGFADFRVESIQVAISPDKQDIFITVNVSEGDRYTISDVQLAGDLVVPEAELRRLIYAQPGQLFSQQVIALSEEYLTLRLGQDGYGFAQVQAVPELDEETKEVSITFFVDPRNRVYVRRISFNGADSINDEVFRREMRQLEGAYLSNAALERSQIRLQRLPYIESVEFETVPVPGSPDLVDIDFSIEEGLPGQFGGGIGYSEYYGLTLNGNFVHSNFMGTGNRVGVDLSGGDFYKVYSLNFTDPYRTIDELSRTLSISYRDIRQFTSATSDFSTQTITAGADWSYPVTEMQYLRFGLSASQAQMVTGYYSSQQAEQWVRSHGNPFTIDGGRYFGTSVETLDIALGWSFDSRNRFIFPTRGLRLAANLSASIPGSEVEYYIASLDYTQYIPLFGAWMLKLNSELALGEPYGEETLALPPYRYFYGGGPGTVRGYRESWLGPRDSLSNPHGGNLLIANQFELVFPLPERFATSARAALFYDVGNVFHTGGVTFYDRLGDTISYDFDPERLKHSVGLAVEWLAPLGLLRFSYGLPLNADEETDRHWGDRTEEFQFTVGNAF